MNKKAIALVLALLLLMAAALFGLPLMTGHIQQQRQDAAIYVTATPAPEPDEYGVYGG
ncbi:MAG: hypothetical protein RSE58_01770 [Clostridia bacterium]